MIMTGLKAFGMLSAPALCITAYTGAYQKQTEGSACFWAAHTDSGNRPACMVLSSP